MGYHLINSIYNSHLYFIWCQLFYKERKGKQNAYRTGSLVFELRGKRSVGLSKQGEDKRLQREDKTQWFDIKGLKKKKLNFDSISLDHDFNWLIFKKKRINSSYDEDNDSHLEHVQLEAKMGLQLKELKVTKGICSAGHLCQRTLPSTSRLHFMYQMASSEE